MPEAFSFHSSGQQDDKHIWVVFPRTGKMSKICHNFSSSLELYCDQTVLFFQVFSIVLKSFCPLQSKNTFVLVQAIFFWFLKKLRFLPDLIAHRAQGLWAWCAMRLVIFFKIKKNARTKTKVFLDCNGHFLSFLNCSEEIMSVGV